MAKFMLILHQSPGRLDNLAPEEMQRIIGGYIAWREGLAARGQLVGGEKLADEGGRRLKLKDGELVATDGPFSELAEVVGGYFMIEAGNYAEAEQIAATCPHLAGAQWIEVRRIEDVHA